MMKFYTIVPKRSSDIRVFFRYARVKKGFHDLISEVLIKNNLIKNENEISDISMQGGGIDRKKLYRLISNSKCSKNEKVKYKPIG